MDSDNMKVREWLYKTLFKREHDLYLKIVSDISRLSDELESYKAKLEEKKEISDREKELIELEIELNSKYPKKSISYTGRYIPNHGKLKIDVRGFLINRVCYEIQFSKVWSDLPDDEKALMCLKWVIDNIKYTPDKTEFDLEEYWTYPQELLFTKKGDCDDGAILLANIMELSGIPYFKIRLTCGSTPDGGHAYVTYYRESDKTWVNLDWCYYPSKKPIDEREDYKNEKQYGEVWFSWSRYHCFQKGVK